MSTASFDPGRAAGTMESESWLVPSRQAWFAFGMAFLLMTVDFIDRQIVVSMLPLLKSEWGL
jgi:hypothetical protein